MKKRSIALILSLMTFMLSVHAFAAADDDVYAALTENITSAKAEMTYSLTLDKISDELAVILDPDGNLSAGAALLSSDIKMALKASEDGMAAQGAGVTTVRLEGVESTLESYVDMDLSDADNLKYRLITRVDDADIYVVTDMGSDPQTRELLESIRNMAGSEAQEELNNSLSDVLPKKAFTEKDGVYTLSLSAKELSDALEGIFSFFNDKFSSGAVNASAMAAGGNVPADAEEQIKEYMDALGGVSLFADDAITLSVGLDDEKHLSTLDAEINLALNLHELIEAVKPLEETAAPEGLSEEEMETYLENQKEQEELLAKITKENSDIEASLKLSAKFSDVNGDVEVKFPELTEENSVNAEDMKIDENKINVFYKGYPVKFDDVEPIIENERVLVPLRKFCNVIGISNDNIGFENGVITIQDGDTTLVLTIDNDEVTKTVGGKTETIKLDVPATIKNDRTLVPLRFVSENFNCVVDYMPIENSTGSVISIMPYSPEADLADDAVPEA